MGSTTLRECETMDFKITHNAESDYLVIEITGSADVEMLKGMVMNILKHPSWHEKIPALVDFRGFSAKDLSSDHIVELSSLFRSINNTLGSGNTALVVSNELDFGLARMWQMMTEEYVKMEIDVFKSIEEAKEWMLY